MPRQAIVIGGGIGGLAAAVALGKVEIDCQVFERAPAIQEVGAGLSLWSNAVRALSQLGLEAAVITRGSIVERSRTVTPDGRLLAESSFVEVARRAGAPSICAHRADLQRSLADAIDPDRLHTASECVGFEQDTAGVTARFADGRSARGDFLIGADGLHSVVRDQILGKSTPRYAGYFAWRAIASFEHDDLPPGLLIFVLGRGTQLGLMHCGPGLVYWFATRNAPPGSAANSGQRKREVLDAVAGWPGVVREAVEATEESAILRNDVLDRPPVDRWGEGRVTLLGDAAHATTPNLGQGACQAIEDAVVLADCLRHSNDVLAGLRAYEDGRRARTAMVIRRSWQFGKILQWENPVAVRLRSMFLRSRFAQHQSDRMVEQMLVHELPELPRA